VKDEKTESGLDRHNQDFDRAKRLFSEFFMEVLLASAPILG